MKHKNFLKIAFCFLLISNFSYGQGAEPFANLAATNSYADDSFIGEGGVTWSYISGRRALGNFSPSVTTLNLPALMLRDAGNNSKITSSAISGGIGNFSVKLYKGFTGSGNRQVELFINGVSKGTSDTFDDYDEHIFSVTGLNISGNIIIELRNVASKQVIIDDITWTAYSTSNPTVTFDSATSSETETDVTFATSGIPITLTNYTADVTVTAAVNGSSTAEAGDYTIDLADLVFDANETLTIPLSINDDADLDDETIVIDITVTSGTADLSTSTHTVTITDDEVAPAPTLIITEVADPQDNANARFFEIYNYGSSDIDFSVDPVYISRFVNGNGTATESNTEKLTSGVLLAKSYLVVAASGTNFTTEYGYSPNEINAGFAVNGDDPFGLYYGTYPSGTLLDVFGEIGVQGTSEAWNYENARAYRTSPDSASPNTTWTASEWTIQDPGNANDCTPGAFENEYRYDGDWKPRNISNATSSDNAYITSNVTLTGNLSINNFEVTSGNAATVNGTSLIVNGTSSGNVTYNRNLGTENWYLVSSPVAGETYDDAYVAANSLAISGTNNAISTYVSASNSWSYMQTADAAANFNAGQGYSVRLADGQSTGDISFTGTINTESVETSSLSVGYHLLGNPFTSYVNSATFLEAANSANLDRTQIWLWNQATGMYEVKISGRCLGIGSRTRILCKCYVSRNRYF